MPQQKRMNWVSSCHIQWSKLHQPLESTCHFYCFKVAYLEQARGWESLVAKVNQALEKYGVNIRVYALVINQLLLSN
ncbi:hypothetical protein Pint_27805 [Pistacia integerrima]|uniref:Uncharacterized protein n=1 Tax=Pistacia integerrima TaxID=434235 RepID=A0ACC0YPV8_9ROSI|nr:hypothetical protein Pint_27805 [Pistacia integerrima]